MDKKLCVLCGKTIINPRTNRKYHKKCYLKKVKEDKRKWKEENPNYDKEYYKKNKEHLSKKNKEWERNNPKKVKEYKINWAKANKRKVRKSKEKYRKKNREKIREKGIEYYYKNKEKYRINQKKWRKKNPIKNKILRDENRKIYGKKYPEKVKARNKSAYHIKIPKGQLCQICNKRLAVERHHTDYSKPLNLLFVCRKCHKQRHREEIKRGND